MKKIVDFSNSQVKAAFIIIIFYIVGFIGFNIPKFSDLFISLVPYHLIWMAIILFFFHLDWNRHFVFFVLFIFTGSFFLEVLGTNTGVVFGHYTYGKTLGFALWQTPILIGLNWLVLVYCVSISLVYLKISNNLLFAFLGAFVLTVLDILIEPVAIKFDYWHWNDNLVPMQNYLAWFVFSFFFVLAFRLLTFNKQNPLAVVTLVVQFLFFMFL